MYANPADPGAHAELLGLLHSPHRVACRLVMILLSHQGWSPAAIASLLGYDPLTVRRWLHRYNHEGVVGLIDRPRPGRPRLGNPRLGERIRRLLAEPRAWTVARLYQRLGRPAMSMPTLHRRVREVACWRRPRLVAKGDRDRDQILAALQQTIAELPEGSVVLAEDETHLNLLAWVRATWVVRGTRQQVMTPGKNRRRTIFGAVDVRTGRFLYQVARKAVSATFIAFLEQLQQAYPAAPKVAVVCDNVIIHHSKLVGRWLAAHPRVVVLHGARYSPHDNPVERVWGALKAWLANSPTLTIQGRVRQVHAFFGARTPAQMLSTATPSSSPWLPEGYGQNYRAAALVSLAILVVLVGMVLGNELLIIWAAGVSFAVLPLAIGAAILRYRLYDLDRIVSRTLTHGLLTVLLAGGYAAVVLGLGRLLPEGSSLVVAAATLAVAAVFQPARRRIQQAVDRRFNRRRYDAAHTIAAFSDRLRQQVDLDTLTAELLAVVEETMQPTRASLWLRSQPPAERSVPPWPGNAREGHNQR